MLKHSAKTTAAKRAKTTAAKRAKTTAAKRAKDIVRSHNDEDAYHHDGPPRNLDVRVTKGSTRLGAAVKVVCLCHDPALSSSSARPQKRQGKKSIKNRPVNRKFLKIRTKTKPVPENRLVHRTENNPMFKSHYVMREYEGGLEDCNFNSLANLWQQPDNGKKDGLICDASLSNINFSHADQDTQMALAARPIGLEAGGTLQSVELITTEPPMGKGNKEAIYNHPGGRILRYRCERRKDPKTLSMQWVTHVHDPAIMYPLLLVANGKGEWEQHWIAMVFVWSHILPYDNQYTPSPLESYTFFALERVGSSIINTPKKAAMAVKAISKFITIPFSMFRIPKLRESVGLYFSVTIVEAYMMPELIQEIRGKMMNYLVNFLDVMKFIELSKYYVSYITSQLSADWLFAWSNTVHQTCMLFMPQFLIETAETTRRVILLTRGAGTQLSGLFYNSTGVIYAMSTASELAQVATGTGIASHAELELSQKLCAAVFLLPIVCLLLMNIFWQCGGSLRLLIGQWFLAWFPGFTISTVAFYGVLGIMILVVVMSIFAFVRYMYPSSEKSEESEGSFFNMKKVVEWWRSLLSAPQKLKCLLRFVAVFFLASGAFGMLVNDVSLISERAREAFNNIYPKSAQADWATVYPELKKKWLNPAHFAEFKKVLGKVNNSDNDPLFEDLGILGKCMQWCFKHADGFVTLIYEFVPERTPDFALLIHPLLSKNIQPVVLLKHADDNEGNYMALSSLVTTHESFNTKVQKTVQKAQDGLATQIRESRKALGEIKDPKNLTPLELANVKSKVAELNDAENLESEMMQSALIGTVQGVSIIYAAYQIVCGKFMGITRQIAENDGNKKFAEEFGKTSSSYSDQLQYRRTNENLQSQYTTAKENGEVGVRAGPGWGVPRNPPSAWGSPKREGGSRKRPSPDATRGGPQKRK